MPEFKDALFAVPMSNHKLECPHCHQQISVKAMVAITPGDVYPVSATSFKTDLNADLACEIKRIEISHTCEYQKEI